MTGLRSRFDLLAGLPGYRRKAVLVAVIALGIWLFFFDSHSLLRRFVWTAQAREVRIENDRLSAEIDSLRATVAAGLSRDDIERIARTQYGMSRPDETVHLLSEQED